jgi:hypothetical protein
MNLAELEKELQQQRRDKSHQVVVKKLSNEIIDLMKPGDIIHVSSSGNQLRCTWRPMVSKKRKEDE